MSHYGGNSKKKAYFSNQYNENLLRTVETKDNINMEEWCVFLPDYESPLTDKDKYSTIVPINGGGLRLGTLMLTANGMLDSGDLILAEYGATVIGMEIFRLKSEKMEEVARQKAAVGIAINTLSHSELEAVEQIFDELDDTEGIVVSSKIADKIGVTRSSVANALKKLESASIVNIRSLGMKGTYIKVLNNHIFENLKRIGQS